MCIYVYIYVYISLSPKTVRVTCIDLAVLIVTCSSLRVSQRLLILIMKNHGRCVNISNDHLKHSGRNFNYGHSTVLCTCIHVILNKDVHQKNEVWPASTRSHTHMPSRMGRLERDIYALPRQWCRSVARFKFRRLRCAVSDARASNARVYGSGRL